MFPLRTFRLALVSAVATSLLLVATPLSGLTQEATPEAECVETTPDQNAELATMYWEEAVWGEQGLIATIVAEDEIHHWGIGGDTQGFDAFAERWGLFLTAFPDLEFTVDQIVADDDMAATRWTAYGTHKGEWMGIAATDREVSWTGINLFQFECGLIVESWGNADHLGLQAQLEDGAAEDEATPEA